LTHERDISDERRVSQCPACHQGRGLPVRIAYGATTNALTYECPICRHHWDVPMADPDARFREPLTQNLDNPR